MKLYLSSIKITQEVLLAISIIILACLPNILILTNWVTAEITTRLYLVAHISLFLVMIVRPLADLLRSVRWIRPLVILRKGLGVFSAAIVVSFIFAKIGVDAMGYFGNWLTIEYWSVSDFSIFAHTADISALLLLITSNNLSKRILKTNWKRLQRLSYVYFYGSSIYLLFVFGDTSMIWYLTIVTLLTTLAWGRNQQIILRPATANLIN